MNTSSRSPHVHTTPTTIAQSSTEDEVSQFYIDLSTLNDDSLDHLRNVGLLPPLMPVGCVQLLLHDDDDELLIADDSQSAVPQNAEINSESFDPFAIRLLRSAHTAYLSNALCEPLSRGFVSLDASHPWMVYWCLHSLDLLGYFDDHQEGDDTIGGDSSGLNDVLMDVEVLQKGQLLSRIVSTLSACWTDVTVEILKDEVFGDARLKRLYQQQQKRSSLSDDTLQEQGSSNQQHNNSNSSYITIQAGGFGGGPTQMPHCAPTYAAILSLSIVASLGMSKSPSHPYHGAGQAALSLLSDKRLQLYALFVSLRVDASDLYGVDNSTAFRMQHDGEIDVRASYCLLAPSYLLGLLNDKDDNNNDDNNKNNLLSAPSISRHIASCQTFEGGFGAEPHNEAHGGYTFCALAALRILNKVHLVDVEALRGWLARRQLGFEGGFCGRTNKLVDGCYSFWQGGAVAVLDGWLLEQNRDNVQRSWNDNYGGLSFDELLLQRYILLCAQDVNGGLRDKPSKQRDFYHSCYNLSGLSVAQHKLCETWPCMESDSMQTDNNMNELFGDKSFNMIGRTDPVINIRVERVQFMLNQTYDDE